MERGLTMFCHALLIGVLLYLFMFYVLKQGSVKAEDRSILMAAVVLVYMILFGHGLPRSINRNIMS